LTEIELYAGIDPHRVLDGPLHLDHVEAVPTVRALGLLPHRLNAVRIGMRDLAFPPTVANHLLPPESQ